MRRNYGGTYLLVGGGPGYQESVSQLLGQGNKITFS